MTTKNSELEKRVTELEVRVRMIEEKLKTTENKEPTIKDIKVGDLAGLLGNWLDKK